MKHKLREFNLHQVPRTDCAWHIVGDAIGVKLSKYRDDTYFTTSVIIEMT